MSSRAAIEAAIPHREPFLFVDRVVEREEDGLTSEWTIPADADWFRGHYPGRPVMPGVLLLEHVFQSAALWIATSAQDRAPRSSDEALADGVPVLTKIEGSRFRRMVAPGETIRTRVRLRETLGPAFYMQGRVQRGDERVLDVRFVVSQSGPLERLGDSMRGAMG